MLRSEKIVLKKDEKIAQWLDDATAIYNQVLYYLRQEYFQAKKENRKPEYSKIDLYALVKESDSWKNSDLDYNVKQQVIRKVDQNWKSFYKACKSYWNDKSRFLGMPKLPRYLKNGRSGILVFDKTRLKTKWKADNIIGLPKSDIKIQIPKYIEISTIRCLIIKKYYGKVKVAICYEKEMNDQKLDKSNWIGIDIGVNNVVAITASNQHKSWIAKGGAIKSMNQFYNKELAKMKSILEKVNKRKTSKRIQTLNMKRQHKLDYEFHCLSKRIVNLCIENNIGSIVIGHNKNWKQETNLKKKNNQNFVQIPFNDLIWKIQYKCEENGIDCIMTEESYTSKCDHLALESMSYHESYLGKRSTRGKFKSSIGKVLNADINGAIGMLRKANALSDADLVSLRDRGDVVSPLVLRYKL